LIPLVFFIELFNALSCIYGLQTLQGTYPCAIASALLVNITLFSGLIDLTTTCLSSFSSLYNPWNR